MKTHRVAFILIASVISLGNLQPVCAAPPAKATAKRAPAAHGVQAAQSDVVVTKNADGTVEASDAPAGGAAAGGGAGSAGSQDGGGGGITYHAAPPATLHYGDGVVVHRNADGSVDVEDSDSAHPEYHSFGSAPAASHAHHHATGAKSTVKHTTTKAK